MMLIMYNGNLLAYKLQVSLNEEAVVDRHGCHTNLKFQVKAKENQNTLYTLYGSPKLLKNPTKQVLLQILVPV